jgi:hypothetical protein
MNVENGKEAVQFHFWEFMFRNFGTVQYVCHPNLSLSPFSPNPHAALPVQGTVLEMRNSH